MGHSHQGLGSLLIKPSVWAGQAPAAHPGHGRFRLKARMKRPGGYRATFPGVGDRHLPCQPVPDQPQQDSQADIAGVGF